MRISRSQARCNKLCNMAEEFHRTPVRACKIPDLGLIRVTLSLLGAYEPLCGMSYENRSVKATCPKCNRSVYWQWKPGQKYKPPISWHCTCGYTNHIAPPPPWPGIPHILYLGHEQHRQLRIHPIQPGTIDGTWNQPYSVRSFLLQASRALGGCSYGCITRGTMMDEPVFIDLCDSLEDTNDFPESWPCHIAAGWTNGETSCPLWERIANLCQSDPERLFLYRYLSYTKHRQFPMLLPQTRIGSPNEDARILWLLCLSNIGSINGSLSNWTVPIAKAKGNQIGNVMLTLANRVTKSFPSGQPDHVIWKKSDNWSNPSKLP